MPDLQRCWQKLLASGRPTASNLATLVVAGVALAIAVTLSLPYQAVPPERFFNPEHVAMLGMVDNHLARLAHRTALVVLAVLSVAVMALSARQRQVASGPALAALITAAQFRRHCGLLVIAAAAAITLLELPETSYGLRGSRRWHAGVLLASVCLGVAATIWAERLRSRTFSAAVLVLLCAYFALLIVPGLASPIAMSKALLQDAETHYSVTLAQADRLAGGMRLGAEVSPNYGLIVPALLAALERRIGYLDFGAHIRLVQASQVLFLLTACAAYALWRPRNPLFLLLAAALIGPWLSTSHFAVFYPNQAGWRAFGLAAGIVLLLLMRRQPQDRAALWLGAGATLLLLFNPETGVCLAFGFCVFALSRLPRPGVQALSLVALRAIAGALAAVLLVLALYRIALGNWALLDPDLLLGFVSRFGRGYGSLPLYFDPLAMAMFAHSAYIVARSTALCWRGRGLRFEESFRFAVATVILLWFAYYANRPHPWNLWTFKFLYLFLVADFLDPRLLALQWRRKLLAFTDPRLAVPVFLLLPMAIVTNDGIRQQTLDFGRKVPEPTALLSGIRLPQQLAEELAAKSAFLARQDAATTLYFTRHAYSLALLGGRFQRLSMQDAFAESITDADLDRLIAEILDRTPKTILFDAADESPQSADRYHMRFYRKMQARLAGHYRRSAVVDGWEVWVSK